MLKTYLHTILKLSISIILIIGFNTNAFSQEKPKKIKPKLRLNYTKYINGPVELNANAYYKKNKRKEACTGATVGFYSDADRTDLYSNIIVNEEGFATLKLRAEDLATFRDSLGYFNFYAKLEQDEKFKERKADISILDADLNVKFVSGDSINILMVTLLAYDTELKKMIPQNRTPLKVSVKRALSMLSVGGSFNYTDTTGYVQIEFPNNIPGDEKGKLDIMVQLLEDDDLGTVTFNGTANWGTPLVAEQRHERSLAGGQKNAPLIIVIGITATLAAIWAYIFYILYGLLRIRRSGEIAAEI